MKRVALTLSLSLAMLSQTAFSSEVVNTLSFEVTPHKNSQLHCQNDDNIKPEKSDFELVDYTAMSSEIGERVILVTLKNRSTGQRIFNHKQVIAILGDCTRKHPQAIEQKFAGGEIITTQLHFGYSKYPLLKLLTSDNLK
ncbi:hypothetical protein [Marinagarivorans cellulosilyticus]|uniref:Uncharacterized protein n=1 Tax=Marinagarivorans cellulosilyticus TaxID=2721545 RepID=A0AAN1WE59_9GAMM|nr:hypothetical protein [Marinagarivorans cellulosilyticus]BCD95932.1 hypothetical protein MARGE09_P0131 [Marinagarivorans cellulosilyticus]